MGDTGEAPDRKPGSTLRIAKTLGRLRIESLRLIDRISLIDGWLCLFKTLGQYTPLSLLGRKSETIRGSHGFVDLWVAARLAMPVVLLIVGAAWGLDWLKVVLYLLGGCSILEVVVVQINVVVFGGYWAEKQGKPQEVKSVHRLLVNALHNYAEVIAWFALFYLNLEGYFDTLEQNVHPTVDALNFSFVTMTSFGYTNLRPTSCLGFLLTLVQSAIGLMMALVILGRIVNVLPPAINKTETKDHNGTETYPTADSPHSSRDRR